jgi:hypothetical protein
LGRRPESQDTDRATAALGGAVRLGFDDCIGPRLSKSLRTVLMNPKATEILEGILIAEADYRELAWLIAEAQRAGHDGRMMVIKHQPLGPGGDGGCPGPTANAADRFGGRALLASTAPSCAKDAERIRDEGGPDAH